MDVFNLAIKDCNETYWKDLLYSQGIKSNSVQASAIMLMNSVYLDCSLLSKNGYSILNEEFFPYVGFDSDEVSNDTFTPGVPGTPTTFYNVDKRFYLVGQLQYSCQEYSGAGAVASLHRALWQARTVFSKHMIVPKIVSNELFTIPVICSDMYFGGFNTIFQFSYMFWGWKLCVS